MINKLNLASAESNISERSGNIAFFDFQTVTGSPMNTIPCNYLTSIIACKILPILTKKSIIHIFTYF